MEPDTDLPFEDGPLPYARGPSQESVDDFRAKVAVFTAKIRRYEQAFAQNAQARQSLGELLKFVEGLLPLISKLKEE